VSSVLILTAAFGEGHNAAARNLREALLAADPAANVVVSDVFAEAYGDFNKLVQRGYLTVINRLPAVWQMVFDLLDRTTLLEAHMFLYGAAERRLAALIEEHQPDTVVSVYPGCNHLLDRLYRRRLKRPFRTVTIVTDSLTVNGAWYRAHSDFFLTANEATTGVMVRAGVPAVKIKTPGFPVPRIFAQQNVARPVPPADGLWRVLYVINSGHHLAPGIVRALLALDHVALTVTVGRNDPLHRRLAAVAQEAGKNVAIHDWTPDMPRLMAENHLLISKAGGATVQEALAARTPMIITQIVPGQEEGNARLILDHHAGALAVTADEIANAVQQAFANDGAQWQQWLAATAPFSRPDAADAIARFVLAPN